MRSIHTHGIGAPHREAGFTLLEMLVALVVVGLLLATLSDGVRLGVQAWSTDKRMTRTATRLARTDRVFRQLIGAAVPGDPHAAQGGFTGNAHALSFTTVLPGGFGARGTGEADVRLEVRGGQLILLWRPHYRRWLATPPPPSADVLLDRVAQLDLRFWQPGPAGGGRWLSVWTAPVPPPLVRVHLKLQGGTSRNWPDMVVPTAPIAVRR